MVYVVTFAWYAFVWWFAGPLAAIMAGVTGIGVAMLAFWEAGKNAGKD